MDNFILFVDGGNCIVGNKDNIKGNFGAKNARKFLAWTKTAAFGDTIEIDDYTIAKIKPLPLIFDSIVENQLFKYQTDVWQKVPLITINPNSPSYSNLGLSKQLNALDSEGYLYYFRGNEEVEPYET